MIFRRHILAICFATLATALPCAAEANNSPKPIISGNDQAVWLIRPAGAGKDATFDIFARKIGQQFKPVMRELTGRPVAAQAVGSQLHIIFQGGTYKIIGIDGTALDARNTPGDVIALCQAKDIGTARGPCLLAIFSTTSRPGKTPTTKPTTQPAKKPADKKAKKIILKPLPLHISLCMSLGGQWQDICHATLAEGEKPLALAYAGKNIYMLVSTKAKPVITLPGNEQNVGKPDVFKQTGVELRQLDVNNQWQTVPLETAISPAVNAIQAIDDRLVFLDLPTKQLGKLFKKPATIQRPVGLQVFNPKTGRLSKPLPIQSNNTNVNWQDDSHLQVTALGKQLAFVWQDEKELKFALCSTSGKLTQSENLTKTIQALPDVEQQLQVLNFFLMGLMISVGLAMFTLKPRTTGPKLFVLPAQMVRGNLIKRLVAAFIDIQPANLILVGYYTLIEGMDIESFPKLFQNPETIPAGVTYASLAALVLYIAYGFLMEWKLGWTLGKKIMGLRVVSDEGHKLNPREAALRNIMKVVELSMMAGGQMIWFMVLLVMLPLITRNRQRLGDMIARTAVIEANKTAPLPPTPTLDEDDQENENTQPPSDTTEE